VRAEALDILVTMAADLFFNLWDLGSQVPQWARREDIHTY
jgi:hypothetical protein